MRFHRGSRVVLLEAVQGEPAGARGVVERDAGFVVIVRFESGTTMSVRSDKLGADQLAAD